MARLLLGTPIVSDVSESYIPTLSGGSWLAGLPLANLQDRRLARVARSTTDAIADTKFVVDLQRAVIARVVAIPKSNLTLDAKWRVRAFTADPVLDSLGVDETGWTAVNSPTVTADAAFDSLGVPLDLLIDDSGTLIEHWTRNIGFTGNAQKVIAFRIKKGTSVAAAGSAIVLRDTTAAADRLNVTITWTGNVPSLAFTTGSLVSSTHVGNDVYRVVVLTSSVTATNTNQLQIQPAKTAAQQGNLYFGDVAAWNAAVDSVTYDSGRILALDAARRINRISPSQDFTSTWLVGGGTFTPGQADPWGGIDAVLIDDASSGANGYLQYPISFTGDGTKAISVYLKKGSAAAHQFGIRDETAATYRHLVTNTWTAAGAPSLATASGSGTIGTPVYIGQGWYRVAFTAPGVVAANSNQLYLGGANLDATSTGNTYFTGAQAADSDDLTLGYARTPAVTADDLVEQNVPAVVFPPATMTAARYWRFDFTDTANPDNYVELGRLMICAGWQPSINMLYGARIGWDTSSMRTETDGGSAYYNSRPRRRVLTFALGKIPEDEALRNAFDGDRRLGITGQLFVSYDPDDKEHLHRRSFAAVNRELSPLEAAEMSRYGVARSYIEEL